MANRLQTPVKILNKSHPLSRGLIGSYLLNEQGGTNVYDGTGMNNGTFVGTPTWTKSQIGNALSFTGTGNYVSVPGKPNLQNWSSFTISMWVYFTAFANYKQMFFKSNAGSTYIGVLCDVSGKVNFQISSLGTLTSTTALSLNTWYHVVVTRSANGTTGNCQIYINGVKDATTGTNSTTVDTSTSIMTIGADSVFSRYMTGSIADVKIWNRGLTQSEIRQLYTNPFAMYVIPKTISTDYFAPPAYYNSGFLSMM